MGCEKMLEIQVVGLKKVYKFVIEHLFDRNNSFYIKIENIIK